MQTLRSSNIVFARSPSHIHQLTVEFRKNSATTLTKSIKSSFAGAYQKMLLYAIETSKRDPDHPGVWRDAKRLEDTMEGAGTRTEALNWRSVTRLIQHLPNVA